MKFSINPVLVVPVIGLVILYLALQGVSPFREVMQALDHVTSWIPTKLLVAIGTFCSLAAYKGYKESKG